MAIAAWGDDATNSAADQAAQMGMHHDGIAYFPLDGGNRGLLVMNHEYTDDGPAARHPLMKTATDLRRPERAGHAEQLRQQQDAMGSYLSGEENFANYFHGGGHINADQKRWCLRKTSPYRWAEHDARFSATRHPNEFHRFGWVVEIDPMDPTSIPVKRTALGRAAH